MFEARRCSDSHEARVYAMLIESSALESDSLSLPPS